MSPLSANLVVIVGTKTAFDGQIATLEGGLELADMAFASKDATLEQSVQFPVKLDNGKSSRFSGENLRRHEPDIGFYHPSKYVMKQQAADAKAASQAANSAPKQKPSRLKAVTKTVGHIVELRGEAGTNKDISARFAYVDQRLNIAVRDELARWWAAAKPIFADKNVRGRRTGSISGVEIDGNKRQEFKKGKTKKAEQKSQSDAATKIQAKIRGKQSRKNKENTKKIKKKKADASSALQRDEYEDFYVSQSHHETRISLTSNDFLIFTEKACLGLQQRRRRRQ